MARKRYLLPAITLALAASSAGALAADYPQPPPPQIIYQPPVIEEFSGWYLRGDIGFSQQQVKSLDNLLSVPGTFSTPTGYGFDSAGIFGVGFGYYWNDWLRFDVTGEYRARANFHGLENFGGYTDDYRASKSEWLFLANAYVDLGTWYRVTPFVGVGVGMSRNTIHNFVDNNIPNLGVAFAENASKWNFAWALHAGLAYKVSKNLTLEFSYRYLDLGDAVTGDLIAYDGTNDFNNPTTFKHLTSHDFRFGLRFNLEGFYEHQQPVVYQQPIYAPPPVYAPPQPVLRSRG